MGVSFELDVSICATVIEALCQCTINVLNKKQQVQPLSIQRFINRQNLDERLIFFYVSQAILILSLVTQCGISHG